MTRYNGHNVISGRYGDGDAIAEVRLDSSTEVVSTIDYAHHEIHGGSSFTCHYSQTVSDEDDQSIIAFKTGAKPLHITMSAAVSATAVAYIYEAPTITDGQGTTLDVYNRNRQANMPATTVIDTSATPDTAGQAMYFSEADMAQVAGGTALAHIPIGAGKGPFVVGGMARDTQEWVLKPDTLYAFIVNSGTDDDNTHWIELNWYEHTDKH